MQAVIERTTMNLYKNPSDAEYLVGMLSDADATIRNNAENKLVKMGVNAVPALINCILNNRGVSRGAAAMSIIRIGAEAVSFLKYTAKENPSFAWVSNYLIREIAR